MDHRDDISEADDNYEDYRRASVATYASTIPSEEDIGDEEFAYPEPEYEDEPYVRTAVPSTPSEFADFFPSTRLLSIRHDDTADGNMNLRVDTGVYTESGRKVDLTLFHLRMHDLKTREFSLRRYCRESGREVCNSRRRYTKPGQRSRPSIQRSMSNALASILPKAEHKERSPTGLQRKDSGFGSIDSDEDDDASDEGSRAREAGRIPLPTNTTKLEFSNYSSLDVKRRGTSAAKRYAFEYWGSEYTWKRVVRRNGESEELSYHLYSSETSSPIAHIVSNPMSPSEAREEEEKGGWVPPSSMWISNEKILQRHTDVADVIVATGLIALVDDSIKRKWHRRDRFQFSLPLPAKMNMEYIGPKRLIDEVFHRRGHTATRVQ